MFLSQVLGSELSPKKHHKSGGFGCRLRGTAGPQCHIFQHHQEFNSELPSHPLALHALGVVVRAVAPGGPESAVEGQGWGRSAPRWVVPLSGM